jgi:heparan-alpha-glucosaminide N-acetyltransferase
MPVTIPLLIQKHRIASIDILRALTMVLMIFVNDLWALKEIPAWLGHVERGVDGIGLADTVFPAFLFIVGMSIPFAFSNRIMKGGSTFALIRHVVSRTLALLVMGVYLVNGEYINEAATGISRLTWNIICCTCFIVIWNEYPKTAHRFWVALARLAALVVLVWLANFYRGGQDDDLTGFSPKWWGILGLIGWSYLAAALVTILAKNRMWAIALGWIFFAVLSLVFHAGLMPSFLSFIPHSILGGTEAGLVMGGVLVSHILMYYQKQNNNKGLTIVLALFAGLLVTLSLFTRPYWGLAKLGATPAWLFLCSALTIIAFIVIYWIVDVWQKEKWFNIIRPAGTDTLLTYLIPYFAYGVAGLLNVHLPAFLLVGGVGLTTSILFALFCVGITWSLSKMGIRLKL